MAPPVRSIWVRRRGKFPIDAPDGVHTGNRVLWPTEGSSAWEVSHRRSDLVFFSGEGKFAENKTH